MSQEVAKSAFAVTDTAKAAGAAPAVVRRGRGTFQQRLRTEQHEQQQAQLQLQQQQQQARDLSDTSSTLTTATTSVTLSIVPRTINAGSAHPVTATATVQEAVHRKAGELDEIEAALLSAATAKKDIPLSNPLVWRENFGVYDEYREEVDTVRQLLFRSEKRRRYCVIVGDLQSTRRLVTLKLFGHTGLKPFQLQNKIIRLINLSIARPRPRRGPEDGEAPSCRDVDSADDAEGAHAELDDAARTDSPWPHSAPVAASGAATTTSPGESNATRPPSETRTSSVAKDTSAAAAAAADEAMLYHDVDHYFENVDEVVPLTVRRADGDGAGNETSLANSPVLTSRYFETLNGYFLREFRFLLGMADVRTQNVTVDVSLGAAYYCLPRHYSYTTPLKHATFGEFVERLNQESLQLHFIKDCPPCVSRAVDMECGALNHEANLTLVRIIFFSNERQSRSIARAVWDGEENCFRLLDVENVGVSFRWTIFSLDETFARTAAGRATGMVKSDADHGAPGSAATTAGGGGGGDDLMRRKTIAFPFEVEFRAFRRWKQHGEHPAGRLAEAILDKLSIAEHNLIHHGSNVGYERMDLSHVCEVDYASDDFNVESIIVDHTARGRPEGTDLLVDNTTSLFIENFAAARQLKERIEQYGPARVAAMQTHSNNNSIRCRARARGGRGRGRDANEEDLWSYDDPNLMAEALKPPSKLTFFRSRGSTIHWKLRPSRDVEENIAPMTEALRFVHQVLNTANNIEHNSERGGAGPEAI